MLGDIDLGKSPQKPKLSICLPNRTKIGELTEARDITHDILMGKVNSLEFTVPFEIESKHELVKNPNIDKLKDRYLIKLEQGNLTEWYVINEMSDNSNDTNDDKTVTCKSLAWQLSDKLIRDYSDNVNAEEALNVALSETTWGIGYIDSDFIIRTRNFEVSEKNLLDFLIEISSTFAGILEFDTVNRLISLKKEESIGQNKGLRLSYGKYLQSLSKQSNSDEMVSRFHIFGAENLSIQNLNNTGTTYLENFSYFMYPYEEDANGNVINHSYYMSDNLCKKQLAYQNLIATRQPAFESYLTQLEQRQTELTTLQVESDTLNNELKIIEDQLYLAKGMEQDTATLDAQKVAKQSEITSKQSQVTSKEAEITIVNNNIAALRSEISIENNFTADEIKERNDFIIEKTWQDDSFIDEKDLYEEGIRRFEEMKTPKTTFNIDVVNFLNIVEEQRNWDKLSIGDTVTIEYELMGTNITAKIIEVHFDYENDTISLTIANTADILDEATKLAKKIYDSYSTSTSLDMSKYKFIDSDKKIGEINEIINGDWDATKKQVIAGVNSKVIISDEGIRIIEPTNDNNQIIMNAGVIALTGDAGNTWKTAIKSDKIVAEVIRGKLITSVNMIIQNESGTYTWDGNGFNITRSDDKVKIGINVSDGIKIQSKDGLGIFQDKFYVDINGDLVANDITANNGTFNGTINATGGTFTGTITANSFTLNGGSFNAPTITGGSINIGNGVFTVDTGGNMIATSGTFSGTVSAGIITGSSISGGTISGTSITGGSIVIGTNNKTIINELGIKYAKDNSNTYYTELDSNGLTFKDFYNRMYIDISSGNLVFNSDNSSKYITVNPTMYTSNLYMGGNIVATQSYVDTKVSSVSSGYGYYDSPVFYSIGVGGSFDGSPSTANVSIGQNYIYVPNSVYASGVQLTSSAEYKKDITDYTGDALYEISTTPVRTYHFNNELDTEMKHVGIILQEAPVEVADILGHGVDLYAMVALSWKAIQQLKVENDNLDQRVKILEGK